MSDENDKRWLLVADTALDGAQQMSFDEALFDWFKAGMAGAGCHGVLRFYTLNAPTVTFGYTQSWRDVSAKVPAGYAAVRRITGGGCVRHDEGLTFSLITHRDSYPAFHETLGCYHLLHKIIAAAYAACGIPVELAACSVDGKKVGDCFSEPVMYDILSNGRKVAGGAQRRSHGFVLHQGNLFLNVDGTGNDDYRIPLFRNTVVLKMEEMLPAMFVDADIPGDVRARSVELAATKYATAKWRERF